MDTSDAVRPELKFFGVMEPSGSNSGFAKTFKNWLMEKLFIDELPDVTDSLNARTKFEIPMDTELLKKEL